MLTCNKDPDDLYYSEKLEDIIKFYYCFDDEDELIRWMKNRPSAEINVYEKEGNSEVIFVVPTANINDELTINFKNSIKDYHAIFVESSGKYFNFARSVNRGIRIALRYNPKWIIVSNNDIIFRDDINLLVNRLLNTDNKNIDAVIGSGGNITYNLCRFTFLSKLLKWSKYREKWNIFRKYQVKYIYFAYNPIYNLICESVVKVSNLAFLGEFIIISTSYIQRNNGILFDETYINGVEDIELFLNIFQRRSFSTVRFNIYHIGGASMKANEKRILRDKINYIYFNYKIKNKLIRVGKINMDLMR